ncbi:hypothetical protein PAXRUDRAFT_834308, partial [Paxillus rubicundulus Ve08.2h10]
MVWPCFPHSMQVFLLWGWLGLERAGVACLGTVGYSQPRLTKAHTTRASRSSADLWPVVVGYGWAKG